MAPICRIFGGKKKKDRRTNLPWSEGRNKKGGKSSTLREAGENESAKEKVVKSEGGVSRAWNHGKPRLDKRAFSKTAGKVNQED